MLLRFNEKGVLRDDSYFRRSHYKVGVTSGETAQTARLQGKQERQRHHNFATAAYIS